ncbi:uncharacterized protein V6R79_000415 [Siganus canaliculatus]
MAGVVIGTVGGAAGGTVGGAAGGTVGWALGLASSGGVCGVVGKVVSGVVGESIDEVVSVVVDESVDGAENSVVDESVERAEYRVVDESVDEAEGGVVDESVDAVRPLFPGIFAIFSLFTGGLFGLDMAWLLNVNAALAQHRLEKKNDRSSDFGDIGKVETTGASWETSQQDGLGYDGVRASRTMAETDAGRMERYRSMIKTVGLRKRIDPALIAAIISRESRAGNTLDGGWGDYGKAWGLMQVDVTPDGGNHKKRGDWDSEEHLSQATEILVYFIKRIQNKFPRWTREQALKGGIAAYNIGDRNIKSYEQVDENTTGGDYSNDVVARAQWYKKNLHY